MTTASTDSAALRARPGDRRRWHLSEQAQTILLLLPSILALAVFIYVFISFTFWVSLSNWRTLKIDLSLREPLFATYVEMFNMVRWQADLRNTFVFTIFFIAFAVTLGLTLAILLDRHLAGHSVFRNIFLFPYALSFVVTGVVWRWIFNPETGLNLLFEVLGINYLLAQAGMPPLKPGWITDPTVVAQVNGVLAMVLPGVDSWQVKWGIPLAMIPVAIAATWQLSGFVMALYVGGMATISDEVREAARIDGASEFQVYRKVIIPMLRPVTISVVVILLHVSLKIFDLVYTMAGVGPGFATDVPAIFVFEQMFKATRYNLGSAAAIIMLVLVALVIVPYLASTLREDT
ncbi:MAG: sugar ABC transporter permease [Caldilinea sp.]|nr:sugar ABC transporter permease [Caldilineaceae bacterium]MCB9125944.1 sugar ABC transporter permease [Caldilineaceae bacterium]MCO5209950.1 sugar ABC transporter permease [Caldilinea sp.]MCW5839666.1 sugar ABC transporter permease [Caldilinea sp.]